MIYHVLCSLFCLFVCFLTRIIVSYNVPPCVKFSLISAYFETFFFIQERCPMDLKSKEVLQEALHLRISLVNSVFSVLTIVLCHLESFISFLLSKLSYFRSS